MRYVEQCSTDLCYYLLEGAAPRWAVRVLREQTIQLANGRLTLAIVGSSHFLEMETGRVALSELLACPTDAMAKMECSHRLSETASCNRQYRTAGLAYDFRIWKDRLEERAFEAESRRLMKHTERRLSYSFPKSREAVSAVTCLDWQIDDCVATVATHHTFPGELAVVHTRSVIDFSEVVARQ
ncbi:MAG TPA: DUF2617 family protein [Chloroflexota bacterium]|nr:DUF2617 family protein [Chloroflexota bacterium]HEX2986799.1 DUF2617 family protein [Chloroflexota bacterium]